jgi:DNA-binding LacI/PurR family transcriptional regulator
VDIDGAAGTAIATEHLIASGHRRVAFLGWPRGSGVGDDRRSGWETAMRSAGRSIDGLARHALDGVIEGERLARELLDQPDPPTAVVCASDPLALGAWRNRNLAVVGFDDTPMAQAVGLSSVRQPLGEAAVECVRTLSLLLGEKSVSLSAGEKSVSRSAGKKGNSQADSGRGAERVDAADPSMRHVLLTPHLVVRESG